MHKICYESTLFYFVTERKHKQYSFYFYRQQCQIVLPLRGCSLSLLLCIHHSTCRLVYSEVRAKWVCSRCAECLTAMFQNKCVLSVRMEIFIYSIWNMYQYSFGLNLFFGLSFFSDRIFFQIETFSCEFSDRINWKFSDRIFLFHKFFKSIFCSKKIS